MFSAVEAFSQKEIKQWARQRLVPGTQVVPDGLSCCTAVVQADCIHERNIVGKGKSTKMDCFTWINTILWNL